MEIKTNKLCLIGVKHSGKSTVGLSLASLCGKRFVDLDQVLALQTGRSARELYKLSPLLFQEAEGAALDYALSLPCCLGLVIATGGGIIDNPYASVKLRCDGLFLICLDICARSAWLRISEGGLPPFLQTENPQETHRVMHERRAALYRDAADIVVDVDNKSPNAITDEIIMLIADRAGTPAP